MTYPTIAVVDRDVGILTRMNEVLAAEGYLPICWPRHEDAARWLRRQQPDLLIVDPQADPRDPGWSTLAHLTTDEVAGRIPTIVCSASPAILSRARDLISRGYGVLAKPVELPALRASLAQALAPLPNDPGVPAASER